MFNKVLLQLSIIVNGGESKFVYTFKTYCVYMCLNTNLLTKLYNLSICTFNTLGPGDFKKLESVLHWIKNMNYDICYSRDTLCHQ